ncbi:MAG TPA: tetratricopeptide repeat protein [Rhodopila sp.]|nr:tetratricopeptide repeat protein [Rhodopila sp.]
MAGRIDPAQLGLAMALHQQGRVQAAEPIYRTLLRQDPNDAEVNYLLGIALLAQGQAKEAADRLNRATRRNAGVAAWCALGMALMALGRMQDSLDALNTALAADPGFVDAHYNKGLALQVLGQPGEAIAAFSRALSLRPQDTDSLSARAACHNALKDHEKALEDADAALVLRPRFPAALGNRGNALTGLKRPAEALAAFDQALTVQPDLPELLCNRGDALHELGRLEEALASYGKALGLKPDLAEAEYGQSLVLLSLGRYAEGLRGFEARHRRPTAPRPRFTKPAWVGERPIAGKTLLIHPELYLGDMLQMCRYAVLAHDAGARVVLAAPARLCRLLGSLGDGIEVVPDTDRLPPFDAHCPLMSLPLAFGTTAETIPASVPYLHADPDRIAAWQARLGAGGLRVGVCWQGSALSVEMDRAFPAALLLGLQRPGMRLVSLQTGPAAADLASRIEEVGVETPNGPLSFEETAALVMALDLVITCDTAMAHLAGALGKPAWVLLRHMPEWRWGLTGDRTPWYPTLRLFRQAAPGDWTAPFDEAARALDGWISG